METENFREVISENKEKELFEADLRVDFVRHGKPDYTSEEIQSGQIEGELTEEGKKMIEANAQKLIEGINKENELLILWISPRRRAQQSGQVLQGCFEKAGIEFLKMPKTKESLSDTKITGEYVNELIEKGAIEDWMTYWTENEPPKGVEKPEDVKKRLERILTYLERIARDVHPNSNKKLHFVCLGHEETVRDLLEEGYGLGTKKGDGPEYGEALRVDIFKSSSDKDAMLNLKYRGQEAELGFDNDRRNFYKLNNKQ